MINITAVDSSWFTIFMTIPTSAVKFLWRYACHHKGSYITMIVCLLIWAINEALFPYFTKLMVDIIASDQPVASIDVNLWQTFKIPILGLGITWIVMEISMRLFGIIEVYMYPRFKATMRRDVFDHVKRQSLTFFNRNLSGKISSKIADIPLCSENIIGQMMWHVFAPSFVFVISSIVVAQTNLMFSIMIIVWCTAHIGITLYYMREINTKVGAYYESLTLLNGETNDLIINATAMRLFGNTDYETTRLQEFQEREVELYRISELCIVKINFIRGFLTLVFIFAITYCLLLGWKNGWLSAGDFPMVAMSSFSLIGIVWQSSLSLVDMMQDIGKLNGALSLLKVPHAITDVAGAKPIIIQNGRIEFKDITFGFKADQKLFKQLSVTIESHEKIGLVGLSGSGKTTFVNLLLREYNLIHGQILIDNQDIAGVICQSLHRQISLIPQDTHMFHRSVMENIRYGRLDASDEDVKQAAIKAHCQEFILNLEHGYDTVVGERGSLLSGGQRQRIAIARAILKDAHILILDEATSALDSVTEKNIHDSLLELMQHRTSITIAHRLTTLKMMDRIIVFDKGTIIEQGNYQTLIDKGGYFAHLWSLQKEGFIPERINDNCDDSFVI